MHKMGGRLKDAILKKFKKKNTEKRTTRFDAHFKLLEMIDDSKNYSPNQSNGK